jgi:hypothetical protein
VRFVVTLLTGFVFAAVALNLVTLPSASAAASNDSVEFLIGDRTKETRKWGHVSLRVNSAGKDLIFDFGRYGRMWGKRDASEGEPILRIWNPGSFSTYKNLHIKDGGTTRIYRFESNQQKNQRILDFFHEMTIGAAVQLKNRSFTAFVAKYKTFHAVEVNCTTVSIDAFMRGFPEFNLHQSHYSTARDLEFYLRGAAQGSGQYSDDERVWPRVWWPLDLMALLNDKYVPAGIVKVQLF